MKAEPRIRVAAALRWRGRLLLCRHVKDGRENWLLPGGGVQNGETLTEALLRELREETGLLGPGEELPLEGPILLADSISPERSRFDKHVVNILFAGDLHGSLISAASADMAVQGHRLFALDELDDVSLHPPIQRFLRRWQPGDPCVYLGRVWVE